LVALLLVPACSVGSDCRATAGAAAADATELVGTLESAAGLLTEEAGEAEEFLVVGTPPIGESVVTLTGTKSGFINPVKTAKKKHIQLVRRVYND